jgi:ParB-like chromosome segregation protein Spo0J
MIEVSMASKLAEHPAAQLFPLMIGPEFDALVTDIAEHGLREPIVRHEGLILDGRNRLRACERAEVKPRFVEWDGNGNPETFVVSKNLYRRHLDESQRSMIAARISTLKEGHRATASKDAVASSRSEAAELLNVSMSSIDRAKTVLKKGTSEEIKAVEEARATVFATAERIKARANSKKSRHPVHRRLHYANFNAEIERSIPIAKVMLFSFKSADLDGIDKPRASRDLAALKKIVSNLRSTIRRIENVIQR